MIKRKITTQLYSSDEYNGNYGYEDDADLVVNKYYLGQYPTYRRYFWGYHPSVYIGFSFSNWYYDPFCWDLLLELVRFNLVLSWLLLFLLQSVLLLPNIIGVMATIGVMHTTMDQELPRKNKRHL